MTAHLDEELERIRRLAHREVNIRQAARLLELDPDDASLAPELIGRANGLMKLRHTLLHRAGLWWLFGGERD